MKKIKNFILSILSATLIFPLPVFASLGYEADYCEGFIKKDSGTESVMTGFHLAEIPVLQYTKVAYELGFSAGDEDESGEVIWIKNRVEENIGQNADNKYMLCVKNYGTLFRKYGEMYGVDPNLLALIAAQEGLCQELGNNQSLAAISGGSSYSRPISGGEPQNPSTPVEDSSGYDIIPHSGYRSPNGQIGTFQGHLNNSGGNVNIADTYSSRAGYSDHHTGLVMDVDFASGPLNNKACTHLYLYSNSDGSECWREKEVQVVHSLLADYGFIVRYPEGKDSITGYQPEYWHIRYVGVDAAKALYNASTNSFAPLENYLGLEAAPNYLEANGDYTIVGGSGGTKVSLGSGTLVVLNKHRWTDETPSNLVNCGGQQMRSDACEAFKQLRTAVQNYKEEE